MTAGGTTSFLIRMKRIFTLILALALAVFGAQAQSKYVVGFYNLENLFDTYDDPAHNDEEYLPDGANKWTEEKYNKKYLIE